MSAAGRPRFRVAPGTLCVGSVALSADEARHMRVRRLRPGDRVRLFDGRGREADARIEAIGAEGARAGVERVESARGESPLQVVLVQAVPVKLPRMDDVVRLATELGVSEIQPVLAERSQLPGGGREAVDRRLERWRRIAGSAAKQCGRGRVPEVASAVPVADLDPAELPEPRYLLQPDAADTLPSRLEADSGLTLLVGPEGGWSSVEVERFASFGVRPVRFGPRVLRADSAGAAILAVVQYLAGDLGSAVDG